MYRGKNGLIIRKKSDWLKQWEEGMLRSGFYPFLNVKHIKKNITEFEMSNSSPVESVEIYCRSALEIWRGNGATGTQD